MQCAVALGPRDLVLLEEELDTLRILGHDVGLAGHHRGHIDRRSVDLDAVFGGVQSQPLIALRALQQRLRRNAPNVDARAAERLVEFDAGDGETELCCANASDIAAGAAAEHHDVGSLESRGGHTGKLIPRESFVGSSRLRRRQTFARWRWLAGVHRTVAHVAHRNTRRPFGMAFAAFPLGGATPLDAQPASADSVRSITSGAFVDAAHAFDVNRPATRDRANTTHPARHNESNVNLAFVTAIVTRQRVRARLA